MIKLTIRNGKYRAAIKAYMERIDKNDTRTDH